MRELLKNRGKIINNDIVIKLINMCMAEIKGDNVVGIGKNGFYMAFKLLSETNKI